MRVLIARGALPAWHDRRSVASPLRSLIVGSSAPARSATYKSTLQNGTPSCHGRTSALLSA